MNKTTENMSVGIPDIRKEKLWNIRNTKYCKWQFHENLAWNNMAGVKCQKMATFSKCFQTAQINVLLNNAFKNSLFYKYMENQILINLQLNLNKIK